MKRIFSVLLLLALLLGLCACGVSGGAQIPLPRKKNSRCEC